MSTIYLAAAVRDVGIDAGEDGLVIGTEHEPGKVNIAEKNLAEAGVDEHAEILAGDLLETLPPRLAALADLDRVRSSGDFVSVTVPGQGGTEISMKV